VQGPHDAGGLLSFRRQAAICAAWGLRVNLHAFMQSDISFLAHAQVASTIPNLTAGNQVMHQLLAERLTIGVDTERPRGRCRLPDGPGHGFELDGDAVARAAERYERDGPYVTIESLR
jgi:glucarate dehydratase